MVSLLTQKHLAGWESTEATARVQPTSVLWPSLSLGVLWAGDGSATVEKPRFRWVDANSANSTASHSAKDISSCASNDHRSVRFGLRHPLRTVYLFFSGVGPPECALQKCISQSA